MDGQHDDETHRRVKVLWDNYNGSIANALMDLVEYHAEGREVLAKLLQQSPWLNEFMGTEQSDFRKAEEAFTNDGSHFLTTLQNCVDLYRKEVTSQALANSPVNVYYATFCAEVLQLCEDKAQNNVQLCAEVTELFDEQALVRTGVRAIFDLNSPQQQWRNFEQYAAAGNITDLRNKCIERTIAFQSTEANASQPSNLMR
jgi:hypothetical protein